VVAVIQVVVAATWAAWVIILGDGLWRYLGLIPAAVLCVGAVCTLLTMRLVDERAELASELQRVKTIRRLDVDVMTIKERLADFEMLKQWGIITEQELLEKRRALLDLEKAAPAEHAENTPEQKVLAGYNDEAGAVSPKSHSQTSRPRASASSKSRRKPASRQ